MEEDAVKITHPLKTSDDRLQATALMKEYHQLLQIKANNTFPKIIAGADISYHENTAYAVVVAMETEKFSIVETATWIGEVTSPYQSGLFTFRESPCLLHAFEKLQTIPDAILVDANGILHPQRFGVACHIGISLGIPTIGCAKSLLLGKHEEVGTKAGSYAGIYDNDELVGFAMRTRQDQKPIFISPGHMFCTETARKLAIQLILRGQSQDKQPSPLPEAHNKTVALRKDSKK